MVTIFSFFFSEILKMMGLRKTGLLKLLILIPNVLGILLALAIIGISAVVLTKVDDYNMKEDFKRKVNASFLLVMVAGMILGIVSFFAFFAVLKNHRFMLIGYVIMILLMLPLEIGSGAQTLVSRPKIESELKNILFHEMNKYDGKSSMNNSLIITIQYHLKCCGVDSFKDWTDQEKANRWKKKNMVPASCCQIKVGGNGKCNANVETPGLSTDGCFTKTLQSLSYPFLAIAIICVQILMIPGIILLIQAVRDGKTKEIF